jgi:copper chaperone CopZ
MATVVLKIPDIFCEHCEYTVKRALTPVPGVQSVLVDIPAKQVIVAYDEALVDLDRIKAILRAEDYPVASVSAEPGP